MNKSKLKAFAPKARRDLIRAVTDRAQKLGITKAGASDVMIQGDSAIIMGQPYPRKTGEMREALRRRIEQQGFAQVIEAAAYTWFNRFLALRYMEVHGYLDHGFRVLSDPESKDPGALPQILREAENVELPGLKRELVIELKLAGNKDAELYRRLLLAQCEALHAAMAFLFEPIDDDTELLLPDNLLHSGSIVRGLVHEIDEEDWQEVEVVGWLYQFYISEKKDEVIGTVVKSEDIPAATQLFTPNWIVQYLVQNSVGRLWLQANRTSALAKQWPFYIEPAEQTPEVKAQLDDLIATRIAKDGGTLSPETITVLDPACGSGHILVVAYDVLKGIYLERGYQPRAIPRLILEKNLHGLDIDDRAAQLTGFALLMKARSDDPRILESPVRMNVRCLVDGSGITTDELLEEGIKEYAPLMKKLIELFDGAKTFGSLIPVGPETAAMVAAARVPSVRRSKCGPRLGELAAQAEILRGRFDAVVTNPPYLGSGGMHANLKSFCARNYPEAKNDLFAAFIRQGCNLCNESGTASLVTMQSWMTIAAFEGLRRHLVEHRTITSFLQIGYNSFPEMNSKIAQACAFSVSPRSVAGFRGRYVDLNSKAGQSDDRAAVFCDSTRSSRYTVDQADFVPLPGVIIAYQASEAVLRAFRRPPLSVAFFSDGLTKTGKNARFLRYWWEVEIRKATNPNEYRICHKGGPVRRFYGNRDIVVRWNSDARAHFREDTVARITPEYLWDREGITWTKVTSSAPNFRILRRGEIAETGGPAVYPREGVQSALAIGFLNSAVADKLLSFLSPTLNLQSNDVLNVPFVSDFDGASEATLRSHELIRLAEAEVDELETSQPFRTNPLVRASTSGLPDAWEKYSDELRLRSGRRRELDAANDRSFIVAYGLQDDVVERLDVDNTPTGDARTAARHLLSYAVGCIMGRYSLDELGVVYAGGSGAGFEPSRYRRFPADADGIVPVTDMLWFPDEAAIRVREFVGAVWGGPGIESALGWLANQLTVRGDETPRETIGRYFSSTFYKDHLQAYKNRPLYWLISSGTERAFECLVYIHRYSDATLARMRADYVIPLQGKLASRAKLLETEEKQASATAQKRKLQKELVDIEKKVVELRKFDELLKHYADQRITIDLDDGVKVNYRKFGNLLAMVDKVCGEKDEE